MLFFAANCADEWNMLFLFGSLFSRSFHVVEMVWTEQPPIEIVSDFRNCNFFLGFYSFSWASDLFGRPTTTASQISNIWCFSISISLALPLFRSINFRSNDYMLGNVLKSRDWKFVLVDWWLYLMVSMFVFPCTMTTKIHEKNYVYKRATLADRTTKRKNNEIQK